MQRSNSNWISKGSLRYQYQAVGTALMALEANQGIYRYAWSGVLPEFQESISWIGNELLDSYLADLLDAEIRDEQLFIAGTNNSKVTISVVIAGLFVALGSGLYLASHNHPLLFSFGFTALVALPFWLFLHFAPRAGLARRMWFAQIISRELGRRRGSQDGDKGEGYLSYLKIERFLSAAPKVTPLASEQREGYLH